MGPLVGSGHQVSCRERGFPEEQEVPCLNSAAPFQSAMLPHQQHRRTRILCPMEAAYTIYSSLCLMGLCVIGRSVSCLVPRRDDVVSVFSLVTPCSPKHDTHYWPICATERRRGRGTSPSKKFHLPPMPAPVHVVKLHFMFY